MTCKSGYGKSHDVHLHVKITPPNSCVKLNNKIEAVAILLRVSVHFRSKMEFNNYNQATRRNDAVG